MLNAETNLGHPDWATLPDNLVKAGISFLVVFLVMFLLIGIIYVFQLIFKYEILEKIGAKFKRNKITETTAAAPDETATEDDAELAAAVTAAVYAYLQTENQGGELPPFTVRSIKRK